MSVTTALTARRYRARLHWTDVASYLYLAIGVVLMFGPVLWLVLSSFKTQAALLEFPPSLLPLAQQEVVVSGFDKTAKTETPLYTLTLTGAKLRAAKLVSTTAGKAGVDAIEVTLAYDKATLVVHEDPAAAIDEAAHETATDIISNIKS